MIVSMCICIICMCVLCNVCGHDILYVYHTKLYFFCIKEEAFVDV